MTKRHSGSPQWSEARKMWRMDVQQDGVRRSFYSFVSGRKGMLECRDKAEKWLSGDIAQGNPLIRDVYAAWLDELQEFTGTSNYRQAKNFGDNYILPIIGSKRVDTMTNEQMFQRIINDAYRMKRGRTGGKLSRKTLMNLRSTIMTFVKYCRKCGYTDLHPENLTIPRAATKAEKHILQPLELRILFGADDGDWYLHAYRFAALTGLRPGELLGLKWKDLREGVLSIRRSINAYDEITDGKNANARRSFVVPARAMDVLEDQRHMLNDEGISSEYIFCGSDGDAGTQKVLERHLKSLCKRLGIAEVTPYELRHTWYSMNKELPAELVKAMGGHSESMDTFGVYGHVLDGDMERTARLLDDVASKILDG